MNQKIPARITPRASLDHLKHQARDLLKKAREQNPHAISRMIRAGVLPDVAAEGIASLKLADAQLAIARENGSATWTELRQAVANGASSSADPEGGIEIRGLNQIWLDCTDLAAAARFYGGILGLKQTGQVPGGMLFYDCQGTTLLLGLSETVRPNSVLYFRLEDTEASIQSAYNRLKQAGVKVGDSPHCIARNWQGRDVWLAFFFDPAGNQLAFKVDVPCGSPSQS